MPTYMQCFNYSKHLNEPDSTIELVIEGHRLKEKGWEYIGERLYCPKCLSKLGDERDNSLRDERTNYR